MLSHFAILSQNENFDFVEKYLFSPDLRVDSFFVLSGFLIFLSYDRTPINKIYFIKRFNRIVPAYFIVVIFFAIILFIFSNKTFSEYFNFDWIKYLFSNLLFLNFLHPDIDGVFQNNPISAVNGALWTLKIEIMFYISVPIIYYINKKLNKMITFIVLYFLSILVVVQLQALHASTQDSIYISLLHQLPAKMSFFAMGGILYYYYNYFFKNAHKFLIIAIILYVVWKLTGFYPFYPFSLAIFVVYFATIIQYLGNWGKYGDFSYAIYLIHFPIIQIFISLGLVNEYPNLSLFSIIALVFSISYISWHYLEKPILKRKPKKLDLIIPKI